MKAHRILLAVSVTAAMAMSCSGPQGWSVNGTVAGAPEGSRLAIEACNAGYWYVLDSVTVGRDGKFDYRSQEPAASADIMRITMPGKGSVYFPVDANDMVTVDAVAATFGTGHKLSGSDMAETVAAIDSIIASTSDIAILQQKLAGFVVTDTTGIVAYYTVGKTAGNTLIFDPNTSFGNRIYGAAAQVYEHYKPGDNHGEALKTAYFAGRRAMGKVPAPTGTIELESTGFIDIARFDSKGVEHKLSDYAKSGKVVLLSFTSYDQDFSPAYNAVLNNLYELYHSKGLEIYQVAFDSSEVEWKEAAKNLPWVTVWNSPSDGDVILRNYNVGAVPMTFVINSNGELEERVVDPTQLPAKMAKKF